MILINKKCFNNKVHPNIEGDDKIQHLDKWYKDIMMSKILKKYNSKDRISKGTDESTKNLDMIDKKYIMDNIIPFLEKEDGEMNKDLVGILLAGDFVGNLADLSEEPPSRKFSDCWLKIIGYYVLAKFVFYDLEKMKKAIINSVEENKFSEQKIINIIKEYNTNVQQFNSTHNKLKITSGTISIEYKDLTECNKSEFINNTKNRIEDIKKKICIELQGKEKFYTNSSGDVNKLCDIEKFNKMLKFFIRYDMLTDKQRHIILNTLNVSVCPYCNRQYITSYEPSDDKKDNIDVLATADLDHFYPKAKFQLFSLSLYNFVPACQICNSRMKLDRPIEILYPYAECFGDEVKFEVIPVDKENEGKVLFDLLYGRNDTLKPEQYKININIDGIRDQTKKKYVKGSIEMFQLKNVYQSHKEYAAEIIRTKAIYDNPVYDSVMNTLFNNKSSLNENSNKSVNAILSHLEENTPEELSKSEKNRILYGIDTEDKNQDLDKPLVKLTHDILNL